MNRTPFESDIADRLHALAEQAPTHPQRSIEAQPAERGWHRFAAAAAVLIVAASVAGVFLRDSDSTSTEVVTDAPVVTTPPTSELPTPRPSDDAETETTLVEAPEGWTAIEVPAGTGYPNGTMVWTGTEVLFWGGQTDSVENTPGGEPGSAFDPATSAWRTLPEGPKPAAFGASATWTGDELIVWGGQRSTSAAAYSPSTNSWRQLSDAPISSEFTTAVWTGTTMLVTSASGIAAYDPTTDQWTSPTQPSDDLGRLRTVVWTGAELIVWPTDVARTVSEGVAFNPDTGTWRTLPEPPAWPAAPDLVWTGTHVVIWGALPAPLSEDSERAVGSMYDPTTDEWTELSEPLPEPDGCECNIGSQTLIWAGDHLIVETGALASALGDGEAVLIRWDPDQDSWSLLGTSPVLQNVFNSVSAGDRSVLLSDSLYLSDPGWGSEGQPLGQGS